MYAKFACHFTSNINHNMLFSACVSEDADRSIASKTASVQIGYLKQQERSVSFDSFESRFANASSNFFI